MSSTFTVTCWGCNKSETHPFEPGQKYDEQIAEIISRGWMRRAFCPSTWDKGPWFCGEDCAYNSFNAKRAETYQKLLDEDQVEFIKYCHETKLPLYLWLIPILSFVTMWFIGASCAR